MTTDQVLLLAWLALAHLGADFVLQGNRIATRKFASGWTGLAALAAHVVIVALCLAPFAVVYGRPGLGLLLAVSLAHGLIDRTKIVLTRRAEARALATARRLHEPPAGAAFLGRAWTPLPAALFAADQAAHAVVLWLAWWVFLAGATPVPAAAARIATVAGPDPAAFHRAVLTAVVLLALAIVNIRAGALFVGTLVRPLPTLEGREAGADPAARPPAIPASAAPALAYDIELGPLRGHLAPRSTPPAEPARLASPLRVGEAIGILERLLIAALLLVRAEAAIGLVIAAKTLARFKQLDDREFAEYYLLGTLASVAVAVGSALVAAAALGISV